MNLQEVTHKAKIIMQMYKQEYPEVIVDRDYYPFKLTEEWGECLQAYLMLTDRGRQKGQSKEEIRELLKNEIGDVLGFLILFADSEGIDIQAALEDKWFSRLK
jgi:NTP pyrophosphatase (non-canonical NTP hydrolase)